MSKSGGAPAEDTLLLDYPSTFFAWVPFKAASKRHWPVFLSGMIVLIVTCAITPLQGAILKIEKLTFQRESELINKDTNLTVTTTKLSTDLECWPAKASWEGWRNYYEFDNGRGCRVKDIPVDDYSPYTMHYIGWETNSWSEYGLNLAGLCPEENSHQVLLVWARRYSQTTYDHITGEGPGEVEITASFGEPRYWKQQVLVSMSSNQSVLQTEHGDSIQPLGTAERLDSEFNKTAFESFLGGGQPPDMGDGGDEYSVTYRVSDDRHFMGIGLQHTLSNVIEPLKSTFEAMHQVMFSITVARINSLEASPDMDNATGIVELLNGALGASRYQWTASWLSRSWRTMSRLSLPPWSKAFWVLLNRLLATIQPFTELQRGHSSGSRSVDLKYTSLPPQFLLWKAAKARHILLGIVCFISILGNALSVSLGALFNELPVAADEAVQIPALQTPTVTDDSLGALLKAWNASANGYNDHFTIAKFYLTTGTKLPPWLTEEYYFLPFALDRMLDVRAESYTARTHGVTTVPSCKPLARTILTRTNLDPSPVLGAVHKHRIRRPHLVPIAKVRECRAPRTEPLQPNGETWHGHTLVSRAITRRIAITKIFMADVAFIISMVLLSLSVVTAVVVYVFGPTPFLPRFPDTIGSVVEYVAKSRLTEPDWESTSTASSEEGGDGAEKASKSTYTFGRYTDRDGNEHLGIDADPFVVKVDREGNPEWY
ncbi:hypothetical protein PG994_008737 [Apiospora phragmitis]|uniref:Uncharacterized protein n=1 Tax=Apiospora phragmitis TaxID=2905665 RepID=A0ABR1UHB0_9PEZI